MATDWFSANKEGFRQIHERLVARRGFGLLVGELYQNVMDAEATHCKFCIEKLSGKPRINLTCEDDGHGFRTLSDAWTLYAPSEKKGNPEKAGRFNIGEKIVLSYAHHACIETTSGTVIFDQQGRRDFPRRKREKGTLFQAEIACNQERFEQILEFLDRILVRSDLTLSVNGRKIRLRAMVHSFECVLPTEIGEELRPSRRKTKVEVYPVAAGETASLYELGIPVVETGDKWHYNVGQKVPLNVDRDNVTPAYLRQVRVTVFNAMHSQITAGDTTSPWVNEAASDKQCSDEAVEGFRRRRFGAKSVASDPSNPEANAEATAHGYVIIPPRGLTLGQRANLRRAKTLQSSSQAFPTAGRGAYSNDPSATPVKILAPEEVTPGMKRICDYTVELGRRLLDASIDVRFVWCDKFGLGKPWRACFGRGHVHEGQFDYNVFQLGTKWFEAGVNELVDELLLHEFAHYFESNHLSADYHRAISRLGASLKAEALDDPDWFRGFMD